MRPPPGQPAIWVTPVNVRSGPFYRQLPVSTEPLQAVGVRSLKCWLLRGYTAPQPAVNCGYRECCLLVAPACIMQKTSQKGPFLRPLRLLEYRIFDGGYFRSFQKVDGKLQSTAHQGKYCSARSLNFVMYAQPECLLLGKALQVGATSLHYVKALSFYAGRRRYRTGTFQHGRFSVEVSREA